jgi:hypothetical protein
VRSEGNEALLNAVLFMCCHMLPLGKYKSEKVTVQHPFLAQASQVLELVVFYLPSKVHILSVSLYMDFYGTTQNLPTEKCKFGLLCNHSTKKEIVGNGIKLHAFYIWMLNGNEL